MRTPEGRRAVLNGVLFLCLWHDGLSLEGYFVQALWSREEDFLLDQVKKVPNLLSGRLLRLTE